MNTIARNAYNPYKTQKGFLADPFASLYQTSDEEVLRDESVENLINYAWSLEESIPGDFDLQTVVTEIKGKILSFVHTGLLAYKVKVLKLYRKVHKNFKTFCEKALGTSHWQVNRKIEAARVVIELARAGFSVLPTCEAQARPLTKLYGTELYDKWKVVVNSLKPHMITSKQINEVLGVETKTASLRLPKKLYEQIKRRALEMGLSVEQLLNMLFEDDQEINTVEEEALAKWEKDLETFTNEEIENIQKDNKNTSSKRFSEQEIPDSIPFQIKESSVDISDKTKPSKHLNLKHKSSALSDNMNNCTSQTKKSKNKKPLFEILNLDKRNKLREESRTDKSNKISNNIIDKFSQDES